MRLVQPRVTRYIVYLFTEEARNLGVSLCDKKIKNSHIVSLLRRILTPCSISVSSLFRIWVITGKRDRHKIKIFRFGFFLKVHKATGGTDAPMRTGRRR